MTDYHNLLRLYSNGESINALAKNNHVAKKTVYKLLNILDTKKVSVSEALLLDNEEIMEMMKTSLGKPRTYRPRPDLEPLYNVYVDEHKTKKQLYDLYVDYCKKDNPIKYDRFLVLFNREIKNRRATEDIKVEPGNLIAWKQRINGIKDAKKISLLILFYPFSQRLLGHICTSKMRDSLYEGLKEEFATNGVPKAILLDVRCDLRIRKMLQSNNVNEHYYPSYTIIKEREQLQEKIEKELRDRSFDSVEETHVFIDGFVGSYNNEIVRDNKTRRMLFFEEERPYLRRIVIDDTVRKVAKVQYNCHVMLDNNYYSVPFEYVGVGEVEGRISDNQIDIYKEEICIATHVRIKNYKHRYSTIPEHMPDESQIMKMEWNKARFIRWAMAIGPNTETVINGIISRTVFEQQSYKSCMSILKLTDKYNDIEVENACKKLVESKQLYNYKNLVSLLKKDNV